MCEIYRDYELDKKITNFLAREDYDYEDCLSICTPSIKDDYERYDCAEIYCATTLFRKESKSGLALSNRIYQCVLDTFGYNLYDDK